MSATTEEEEQLLFGVKDGKTILRFLNDCKETAEKALKDLPAEQSIANLQRHRDGLWLKKFFNSIFALFSFLPRLETTCQRLMTLAEKEEKKWRNKKKSQEPKNFTELVSVFAEL